MKQVQNILRFGFLVVLVLVSSCGQSPQTETPELVTITAAITPSVTATMVTQTPEIVLTPDENATTAVIEPRTSIDINSLSVSDVWLKINERANEYFIKPGWLHIVSYSKFDNDNGNNGEFPNGRVIPNEQIRDIWFLLDETHQVVQSASFMKAMDGTIVQANIFRNGISWDPITGIRKEKSPFTFLAEDFRIHKAVQMYVEYGNPRVTLVEFEGQQVIRIAISETYPEPVTNSVDFSQPIIGTDGYCYFDLETGQGIAKKVIVHFSDGTERIFEETRSEITNENSPPDDVLQYFESLP